MDKLRKYKTLLIVLVVLIGKMFGFSRRFEDRALFVPVLYKSAVFGLLVAFTMWLIMRWYAHNLRRYPREVESLLELARSDKLH